MTGDLPQQPDPRHPGTLRQTTDTRSALPGLFARALATAITACRPGVTDTGIVARWASAPTPPQGD